MFDGAATLSGLEARRVSHAAEALAACAHRAWVPVAVEPDFPAWLIELGKGLVVDARLRKHDSIQPDLHELSAWSVGISPGYCAMHNATYAVESAWGDGFGRVIRKSAASAFCGEPRPILGVGRDRLVYAPEAGKFQTHRRIGDSVLAEEVVAQLQTESGKVLHLRAPLSGVLRGLTRGGVRVPARAKLIEVDPRKDPKHCFGLGGRPMKIAEGVLLAVAELQRHAAVYEESGPRAVTLGRLVIHKAPFAPARMMLINVDPTFSAFFLSGEPLGTLSISGCRFIITSQSCSRSSSTRVIRQGR